MMEHHTIFTLNMQTDTRDSDRMVSEPADPTARPPLLPTHHVSKIIYHSFQRNLTLQTTKAETSFLILEKNKV